MKSVTEIAQLLAPFDSSLTECDGMTQLCHTVLTKEKVPHQVKCGVCRYRKKLLPLHFWIDLAAPLQGYRVDYRLRMWFGDYEQVPNGIFLPGNFPLVEYEGICLQLEPLPEVIFQALLIGMPDIESLPWNAMKSAITS